MLISCPIELTPGHKPSWAKEGEDEWVRRVLGLPKEGPAFLYALTMYGEECVAVISHEDTIRRIKLGLKAAALREWLAGKFAMRGLFGSAAVITNPDRSSVLMQVKDDKHPNERCRGRYSLFSGSRGVGEDGITAAMRELYEEIRDVGVVDQIAGLLADMGEHRLPSVQWPGEYVCRLCVATAIDDQQFQRWYEALFADGGLAESNPAMRGGAVLLEDLRRENSEPGSHFVASHNRLIEIALGLVHEG